jgi:hypothetical protein
MNKGDLIIELKGENRKEVIKKYLHLVKELLGITRKSQVEILSCIINRINNLHGQYSSLQELRDIMSERGWLREISKEYSKNNGGTTNSVYQTLNDMRKMDIIDIYNIPKPYALLAPVINMHINYNITVKFNELSQTTS